jgi:hypothetical protein
MKNKNLAILLLVPGLSVLTIIVNSQELKVSDYKIAPLDISARENVVYDPNGDACAIIKARTGIQDMKFSSDLEIKKVEFHDGEYWLWVPPGTHKIGMEAPDFPKIEFTLPDYTAEFNVYIIFLTAVLPETTVYKPAKTVSFITKPAGAEVFINDIFYGFTPLAMNIPFEIFRYRVQSKTFIPETAADTITDKPLDYYFKLKKDPRGTRFYAMAGGGVVLSEKDLLWGFSIGTLGKIGSSFTVSLHKPDSEELRHMSFVFGINPRITDNIFICTGLGFAYIRSEYFNVVNAGITLRTNKRLLFNLNSNLLFYQSHYNSLSQSHKKRLVYQTNDLSLGIGYNF